MLTIIDQDEEAVFHYAVSETLTAGELRSYYQALDRRYASQGKLRILVEVKDFRGYADWHAFRVFLGNEHKLLSRVSHYAAITDQAWFARIIQLLNFLLPHISLRTFTRRQLPLVMDWLTGR